MEQRTAPAGGPAPRREPGTLRIGQIGGVDVLVRSSWLLVAALIAVMLAPRVEQVQPGLGGGKYLAGLAFAVLLYLSVLLHEMSHALMAKRYGLPVKSITLHFLGGVTEIEGEPDTPRREFGVSVVGPLTSIAVGAVFAGLWFVTPDGLLLMAVEGLAGANLLVGVLNLIPGLPLDGGRVLRSAVWKVTGSPHTGTIVAGWGGRVAAVLALSYPLLIEVVTSRQPDLVDYLLAFVIATFLWGGASTAIMSARLRRKLPTLRARSLARRTLAVPHDLPLSEAVRRAQQEQAGSIVVLDQHARPSGIVNEAALLATPEERRPWLPAEAVARSIEPGLMLPADIAGEDLVRAMQRTPATEYLLLEADGGVYGVLTTSDVDRAFAATP
ncbi:site-2 protease family protein [Nocardioides jiangsuensis]|uniref:site-2 protease family protein n=1 Tax=Nocardioides jiangsuensis TaxID=2866161 RepID=UPI0027E3858B|nr:site-2 protease family protein [Nocardioides jiangsuensis]